MFDSFRGAVMRARLHGDLYFAALLEEQHILEAFGPARSLGQGWIYTPAVTMWVFLSQCLSLDHSCREAVTRLTAWQISFKGTLQYLNNFLPLLVRCMPLDAGCAALFNSVAAHAVGNRPDRYEPRRIKRRPKPHKWMQMSRKEYQRRIK